MVSNSTSRNNELLSNIARRIHTSKILLLNEEPVLPSSSTASKKNNKSTKKQLIKSKDVDAEANVTKPIVKDEGENDECGKVENLWHSERPFEEGNDDGWESVLPETNEIP